MQVGLEGSEKSRPLFLLYESKLKERKNQRKGRGMVDRAVGKKN